MPWAQTTRRGTEQGTPSGNKQLPGGPCQQQPSPQPPRAGPSREHVVRAGPVSRGSTSCAQRGPGPHTGSLAPGGDKERVRICRDTGKGPG